MELEKQIESTYYYKTIHHQLEVEFEKILSKNAMLKCQVTSFESETNFGAEYWKI